MTSPASYVRAQLKDALPDFAILPGAQAVDRVIKPTLVIWPETITREAFADHCQATIQCWILIPETKPSTLDDDLFDALTDVIFAVEGMDTTTTWATASRGVFNDRYHGYQIPLSVNFSIERN